MAFSACSSKNKNARVFSCNIYKQLSASCSQKHSEHSILITLADIVHFLKNFTNILHNIVPNDIWKQLPGLPETSRTICCTKFRLLQSSNTKYCSTITVNNVQYNKNSIRLVTVDERQIVKYNISLYCTLV